VPFLEAHGIVKSYPVGGRPLTVVRRSELQVEAGEMVAIVGRLRRGEKHAAPRLGGLDRVDQGTLAIDGIDLTTLPDAQVWHSGIATSASCFNSITAAEFNASSRTPRCRCASPNADGEARPRAEALLGASGLEERLTHRPGMLSGGDSSAWPSARALVMRPAVCSPTNRQGISTSGRRIRCTRLCGDAPGLRVDVGDRDSQPRASRPAADRTLGSSRCR